MTLSIIIPAYNEEARLPRTLEELRGYFALPVDGVSLEEVIVADDGSVDGTARTAEEWKDRLPIKVLRFERNRGKGAVSRDGMLAASGDVFLLYDADGATPIAELPKLVAPLREGRADIAIGSRVLSRELVTMSVLRRFVGRVYHALCAPLLPGIADAACGCKLFSAAVARDLFARQTVERFAFDVEILSLALRHGYRVAEIPVRWTAVPDSRVRLVRDTLQMAFSVARLYWRRWMER